MIFLPEIDFNIGDLSALFGAWEFDYDPTAEANFEETDSEDDFEEEEDAVCLNFHFFKNSYWAHKPHLVSFPEYNGHKAPYPGWSYSSSGYNAWSLDQEKRRRRYCRRRVSNRWRTTRRSNLWDFHLNFAKSERCTNPTHFTTEMFSQSKLPKWPIIFNW